MTHLQPVLDVNRNTRNQATLRIAPIALGVALVLATLIAHFPATHADYIWDDNCQLYENQLILNPGGLYKLWFSSESTDYWPLTSTSLWIEWRIWGNTPAPYHVTNVILHALAAVLLWRVLLRLGLSNFGALLGGLLFAVHPVTVASVAWIAERKNVLSMVLYLFSILAYLRFEDQGKRKWYVFALLASAAALLAKTSVVALPIVLLILTWWRYNRITLRTVIRTAPFFLISLILGLITLWFHHHNSIAGVDVRPEGLAPRVASVGWVFWFYLYKLLAPVNLVMIYPRWEIDGGRFLSFAPLALLLICVAALWHYRKSWGRGPLLALGSYAIVLAPVLGLVTMAFAQYSLVADHLQYPGMPGIMALAGGAIGAAWSWSQRKHANVLAVGIAALTVTIVLMLSVLTWRQAQVYRSKVTFWSHTIAHNDRTWAAYYNRGVAFSAMGEYTQAIPDYAKVIELKPDYAEAYNNRSLAYQVLGNSGLAIQDANKAIKLQPNQPMVYSARGTAYCKMGDFKRAILDFTKAIELKPDYIKAYCNRAAAYGGIGDYAQAIKDYTRAVELSPDFAEAYYSRAIACNRKGDIDQAIRDFSTFIEHRPGFADAYKNRGDAFTSKGNLVQAVQDYTQAIELQPNNADAFNDRGEAFRIMGDLKQAIPDFNKAVELRPTFSDAYNNRGNAFSGIGDARQAIHDYSMSIELRPESAMSYHNRAAAYFGLKEYDKAWADVTKCKQLGGQVHPEFLKALTKASSRPG